VIGSSRPLQFMVGCMSASLFSSFSRFRRANKRRDNLLAFFFVMQVASRGVRTLQCRNCGRYWLAARGWSGTMICDLNTDTANRWPRLTVEHTHHARGSLCVLCVQAQWRAACRAASLSALRRPSRSASCMCSFSPVGQRPCPETTEKKIPVGACDPNIFCNNRIGSFCNGYRCHTSQY
jgi:hypothetical protein